MSDDWCPENDAAYRAELAARADMAAKKYMGQIMAEGDCRCERCASTGYCWADRIEALESRAKKAEAERDALRAAINRAGALACQRASHAFIIDALKETDT